MVASKGNGSGIKINFTADVQKVLDGTAKIEGGLDDVSDKLDDVADTSRASTRKQAGSLDDVKRASRDTYEEVGDQAKKGFKKTSDAGTSAGKEIGAGLKDMAKDFDGSMESVATSATSTLSSVASSIPTLAGVVVGAGAAVAGGFAEKWRDATEETKKNVANMYDDMLQSGLDFLSEKYVTEQISKLFNPGDDGKAQATLREVKRAADELGLSAKDVGVAWVTAGAQRDEVTARATEQLEQIKTKLAELKEVAAGSPADPENANYDPAIKGLESQQAVLEGILGTMGNLNDLQKEALDNTNDARDAIFEYRTGLSDAQLLAQGLVDQIGKLPTQVDVNVRAVGDFSGLDAELRKPRQIPVDLVTRSGKRVY